MPSAATDQSFTGHIAFLTFLRTFLSKMALIFAEHTVVKRKDRHDTLYSMSYFVLLYKEISVHTHCNQFNAHILLMVCLFQLTY